MAETDARFICYARRIWIFAVYSAKSPNWYLYVVVAWLYELPSLIVGLRHYDAIRTSRGNSNASSLFIFKRAQKDDMDTGDNYSRVIYLVDVYNDHICRIFAACLGSACESNKNPVYDFYDALSHN